MTPASQRARAAPGVPRVRRTSSCWPCLRPLLEIFQYLFQGREAALKGRPATLFVDPVEDRRREELAVGALDDRGDLLQLTLHALRRRHEPVSYTHLTLPTS